MPWHDNQSSELVDLLVVLIHSFRMPVFFILAGFFVTMLVQRRGVNGMLKNSTHAPGPAVCAAGRCSTRPAGYWA
ncbi:MAG: hypothetical protein IPO19_13365 [Rhodoferax sp.]|nr:hypothetical protein [Rhodoferax sp.]